MAVRDVTFGRIKLITVAEAITEQLGDTIDAVGPFVGPGERRGRQFPLVLPLRGGPGDANPYADGDRMRRQLRSLMDNGNARLVGIYFQWAVDPEQNGWIVPGGADLTDDEGGVTLSSYKLTLSEPYRVGQRRTHKPARRIQAFDRRSGLIARDFEGRIFASDFAGSAIQYVAPLPSHNVRTVQGPNGAVLSINATRVGQDDTLRTYTVSDGQVLSFEQAEADENKNDVVIFDRRGNTAPAYSLANEADPQGNYGWEEVYGSNYPYTAGDVPVVQNGFCRVLYDAATVSFRVYQWVAGTGYVQRGAIVPHRAAGNAPFDTLKMARVVCWTKDRAVIAVDLGYSGSTLSGVCYITLQRGWEGPRVELYGRSTTTACLLRYVPNDAAAMIFATANWSTASDDTVPTIPGAPTEPWVTLTPKTGGGIRHTFSVMQTGQALSPITDTTIYGGARQGMSVQSIAGAALPNWASMDLRLGGVNSYAVEAESIMVAGGTRTSNADANASGGTFVRDTQTTAAAYTLHAAGVLTSTTTYRMYVRAKAPTAKTMGVSLNGGSSVTNPAVTTSWAWYQIGEITGSVTDLDVAFYSSTAGGVDIDRILLVPMNEGTNDQGARDFAAQALVDLTTVQEIVAR